jgi:hypothetical protein
MTRYPTSQADRAKLRIHIHAEAIAEADARAERIGRSIKCAGDGVAVQHANTPGGCRNSGTTCLCECHDQASP